MYKAKKVVVPIQISDEKLMPVYATALAAGADVRAHLKEPKLIPPGGFALVPTGIRLEIPEGYEIQVRPRSGLAAKHGIAVLNSPGTIDADYRGEIAVLLVNHSREVFTVDPGMRIAQLVLAPVVQAEFVVREELSVTSRADGGFGHTGVN